MSSVEDTLRELMCTDVNRYGGANRALSAFRLLSLEPTRNERAIAGSFCSLCVVCSMTEDGCF